MRNYVVAAWERRRHRERELHQVTAETAEHAIVAIASSRPLEEQPGIYEAWPAEAARAEPPHHLRRTPPPASPPSRDGITPGAPTALRCRRWRSSTGGAEAGEDLVQIAFADTREEAALIRGLLREGKIRSLAKQGSINGPALGAGLLTRSSRRIYVRPRGCHRARKLLGETMVEDPPRRKSPEPANADIPRRMPKATAPRTTPSSAPTPAPGSVGLAVLAVVLVIFLLLR